VGREVGEIRKGNKSASSATSSETGQLTINTGKGKEKSEKRVNNALRWSYSRVVEDAVPGADARDLLMVQLTEKSSLKVEMTSSIPWPHHAAHFLLCVFIWEVHVFKIEGVSAVCGGDDASWVRSV